MDAESGPNIREYMRSLDGNCEMLSAEEEQRLAWVMQNCACRKPDYSPESHDCNCQPARHRLIQSQLRLVIRTALKSRHNTRIPAEDLIQAGNMGLMRAVDKFEPDRGFRLSTYAWIWIRQFIGRIKIRQASLLKYPDRIRIPDRTRQAYSLDDVDPNVESDRPLSEILAATESDPAEDLHREESVQRLLAALGRLTDRARYVVTERIAGRGLQEIADELGCCKERVRQIEARALADLRVAMNSPATDVISVQRISGPARRKKRA